MIILMVHSFWIHESWALINPGNTNQGKSFWPPRVFYIFLPNPGKYFRNKLDNIPLMRYGICTLRDNQRTRLYLTWINCEWKKSVDKEALIVWESCDFRRDMTWHDMIWRDMTWRDMMWHDVIWRGKPWHDVIWRDMTWPDVTRQEVTWHDITWHDMTWHGLTWRCMMWHDVT